MPVSPRSCLNGCPVTTEVIPSARGSVKTRLGYRLPAHLPSLRERVVPLRPCIFRMRRTPVLLSRARPGPRAFASPANPRVSSVVRQRPLLTTATQGWSAHRPACLALRIGAMPIRRMIRVTDGRRVVRRPGRPGSVAIDVPRVPTGTDIDANKAPCSAGKKHKPLHETGGCLPCPK